MFYVRAHRSDVIVRIVFLLLLLIPNLGLSAELYESYISARAAGMGNAYTAIVANDDALFYNPASLTKIGGVNVTLFNMNGAVDGQEAYNSAQSLAENNSGTDFADTVRDLFGKRIWLSGNGKGTFTTKGLGVGVFGGITLGADAGNPAYPTIDTNYTLDYGFNGGVAYEIIPKILSLGFVGKRITRTGARFPIGVETLVTLSSDDLSSSLSATGTGYGVDAGMNIMIPVATQPTLSVVWKNLGTTRFSLDSGTTRPPSIDNEVVFSFGMNIESMFFDVRPVFDYKHAFNWEHEYGKKIHAGIEIALPMVAIRGGLHQGYYALGAGVDLGLFQVDVATWGVELGEYTGQHEDRRYMLEFSMKLGVGGGSGGSWFGGDSSNGQSGGSRGYKQRR